MSWKKRLMTSVRREIWMRTTEQDTCDRMTEMNPSREAHRRKMMMKRTASTLNQTKQTDLAMMKTRGVKAKSGAKEMMAATVGQTLAVQRAWRVSNAHPVQPSPCSAVRFAHLRMDALEVAAQARARRTCESLAAGARSDAHHRGSRRHIHRSHWAGETVETAVSVPTKRIEEGR